MQPAIEVYQESIDRASTALMAMDIPLLCQLIRLPHLRRTNTSEVVIETREDLAAGLTRRAQELRDLGVDAYIRLATRAEYIADDLIEGYHVTHCLRGSTPVVPSYTVRLVVQREGGIWQAVELETQANSTAWPPDQIRPAPSGWAHRSRQLMLSDDARRGAADPRAIYQGFVDALSAATVAGDFDRYVALHCLPHSCHGENFDRTFDAPDQLRGFFDMLRAEYNERGADRLDRRADRAVFLSATQICGYHATTMSRAGQCLLGPIQSRMILERQGTEWRMSSVTNSVANTDFPQFPPLPTEALVTLRKIQERTRK
ncbi:MAG: hypothetical protein NXH82_05160 [Rhodobacteraceae bacterium]|nr:hypothetical protein [Paracoccaceae bacterium]